MIFKTKEFCALTKKDGLSDSDLVRACREIGDGLVDADLGGLLYKKRVASQSKGKRGGYRTIIGAAIGKKYFFLYAFAKNKRANINRREVLAFRELTREFIGFSRKELEQLVQQGELIKVGDDDE